MHTAYAANIWGNSVHACSAFKIGSRLKEIDPGSRRILLTQTAQPNIAHIWEVRQFRTDINEKNQWLIHAKIHFWSLQNISIVMYLDLDIMLNVQPPRIASIWSFAQSHLNTNNIIAPHSNKKCLNGGFNLFKPNVATYRILIHESAFQPTISSPAYRCPAKNTDQYYLNKVFPNFVGVPTYFGYHTSRRRCLATSKIHFLHFFGRFMPWHNNCQSCLQTGGFCSYHNASKCDSIWHFQKQYWTSTDRDTKDVMCHASSQTSSTLSLRCIH
jgi:hypothetical protein